MSVDQYVLEQHPFFKSFDKWYLEQLARYADLVPLKKSQFIFREGEDANRFYLVMAGSVILETTSKGRAPLHIQTLKGGDILGWSWMMPSNTWRFSARAVESGQLVSLNGEYLRAKCEEDHALGYQLMKRITSVMLDRLQATRLQLINKQSDASALP
jgi:CRP/FNR family transcriptional regulator, cyclic AMP receptor protein